MLWDFVSSISVGFLRLRNISDILYFKSKGTKELEHYNACSIKVLHFYILKLTRQVQTMQAAIDCRDTDHFYNFSHLCVVHWGLVFTEQIFSFYWLPSDCCVPLQLAMLSSLSYKGRYWKFVSLYFKCVRVGQCHWHKINNQKNFKGPAQNS